MLSLQVSHRRNLDLILRDLSIHDRERKGQPTLVHDNNLRHLVIMVRTQLTLTDAVGLHLMRVWKIHTCWSTDVHLGLTGVSLVLDRS